MMTLFGNIAFLHPLILSGLLVLPALWFFLRVTPPRPRLIRLPTTHFLTGLVPDHQTSSHTPWWILLLRLTIMALILIALAGPVYNPAEEIEGRGPVRIILDNGWDSAQNRERQIKEANEIITQAGRAGTPVYIAETAPPPGQSKPTLHGPLAHSEAASLLKGLAPRPWPANYEALAALLDEKDSRPSVDTFFLSSGLGGTGFGRLLDVLEKQGGVTLITPEDKNLPMLLGRAKDHGQNLSVNIITPDKLPGGTPVTVQALSKNGQILDQKTVSLSTKSRTTVVVLDTPAVLRGEIARFKLAGHGGAGGLLIAGERFQKPSVGIVGPEDESRIRPFIEAEYYLKRALEPYATLHLGGAKAILAQNPAVIILPDIGAMPSDTLDKLEDWVREGGLLLRFAGPHMAQARSKIFLTPIPLRAGGRSLGGALSWETPLSLADFPKHSPLYGIPVDKNIKVRQQILPEPVPDLEQKIWARLEDGTPLVSAAPLGSGLLVMIHTTAAPEWSDLALSGLYVEMLRRIVNIAGSGQTARPDQSGLLHPVWVLDGFGYVQKPESFIVPIEAAHFEKTRPGPKTPPGLYGHAGAYEALNLGDHITELETPEALPAKIRHRTYDTRYERTLMPVLFSAALMLFLFDWLIVSFINLGASLPSRIPSLKSAALLLLAVFFLVPHARAQSITQDIKYADGLYLAYIQTGNNIVDARSRKGLEGLAKTLGRRTSAEPEGVAALNPEYDTLAFFPLIYWPISPAQTPLSTKALNNIQSYLDHGGTILFDTGDQNHAKNALSGSANAAALQKIAGSLDIPPLIPIPDAHVLKKSFYLLERFPGHFDGGTLWVEAESSGKRDGVSSVIIGNHDWAQAWAAGTDPYTRTFPEGGARQQELSLRFGVNLVIYALTGNYKADQVHVPHILKRLGQ